MIRIILDLRGSLAIVEYKLMLMQHNIASLLSNSIFVVCLELYEMGRCYSFFEWDFFSLLQFGVKVVL
jgi:hypothetical protein